MVLVIALIGFRANHNRQVLLVLIPLIIVNLLYLAFKKISGMISSSAVQFDVIFHSMAVGLTLLWLIVPLLKGRGLVRFVVAFAVIIAIAYLCVFTYGTASSQDTTVSLVFLTGMGVMLILMPIISRGLCRGLYRPLRFMLWLGLWTIIGGVLAVEATLAVLLIILPSGPDASYLLEVVLMALLLGAVMGLCLYALHLPYMILGFLNPFFRHRFQTCLSLKTPNDGTSIP